MPYQILTDPKLIEVSSWQEFIRNHPNGNIFQSIEMFEVYEKTKNYYPVCSVVKDGKKVIGSLIAVIISEGSGLFSKLSSRAIITGGPLVLNDDPQIIKILLESIEKLLRKYAVYIQFRNMWDTDQTKEVYKDSGYSYQDHNNILVDLSKNEEILWKELNSKRRNEIRRALKEGTTVREINTLEEIELSYTILEEVYKRAKLPFADKSLFVNAHNILYPNNMIRYFGAFNENKLIGTMYTLCYKDKIYDWYAGSHKEYYKKYPNDLIPWEVFKWSKNKDYKTFDFGGAGKPGIPSGVRDYKKKFGGELVNFGRFEKVIKPTLFKIGKEGLKIYQKITAR